RRACRSTATTRWARTTTAAGPTSRSSIPCPRSAAAERKQQHDPHRPPPVGLRAGPRATPTAPGRAPPPARRPARLLPPRRPLPPLPPPPSRGVDPSAPPPPSGTTTAPYS